MSDQRGVTLVELLVIVLIMGAIFLPISSLVMVSLNTENEVSSKNDVQREARFIMEYMTDKMRNKNVVWVDEGTQWKLMCKDSLDFTCRDTNTYLIYTPDTNPTLGLGTMTTGSGDVLSKNVRFDPSVAAFDVINDPLTGDDRVVEIELIIDKTEEIGESFALKSVIYYDRFGTVTSENDDKENVEIDPEEPENDDSEEDANRTCPPDEYEDNKGKCKKCPGGHMKNGICTFKQ